MHKRSLKNIEIYENENLVERSRILGERLREEVKEMEDHPHVGDIRSFGFLLGIELVEDKAKKQPLSMSKVDEIIASCKSKGLIIGKNGSTVAGYNNILTISPPLSSTDEDLTFITNILKAVMNHPI